MLWRKVHKLKDMSKVQVELQRDIFTTKRLV